MFNKKAFTLIELLVVIAIMAGAVAVVFVALNPLARFREARNVRRWQDVDAIAGALRLYQINNHGQVPPGLDENWRMLGTEASGCNVLCGATEGGNGDQSGGPFTYNHASQSDFDAGSYGDTRWNSANSWVELKDGQSSGVYISSVIDSGSASIWSTLAWVPSRPMGKELLNNAVSENAYSSGNANLNGNILLLHLNESSGPVFDYSGQENHGTVIGGATYGAAGKLKTAINLNGTDAYINIPKNLTGGLSALTIVAWVKGNKTASLFRAPTNVILLHFRGGGFFLTAEDNTTSGYLGWNPQPSLNTWVQVAATWSNSSLGDGKMKLYLNGVKQASELSFAGGTTGQLRSSGGLNIGGFFNNQQPWFKGEIDEVAIYNRALPAAEIMDLYKRGALRLKFQTRSGPTSQLTGAFIGPDGSNATYYSEIDNSAAGLPLLNLDNQGANQYFQYKAYFETDNVFYTPELKSVALTGVSAGAPDGDGGFILPSACLDLSSVLEARLTRIPHDPLLGSPGKTYYALRQGEGDRINVQACGAEGEEIKANR